MTNTFLALHALECTQLKTSVIDEMRSKALYVCSDRDYFVLKSDEETFVAMVCAELLNSDKTEVLIVLDHKTLDGAVACALAWSSSDGGGADSTLAAAREIAVYAEAWT